MRGARKLIVLGMGVGAVFAAATTVASPAPGSTRVLSRSGAPDELERLRQTLVEKERRLVELEKQLASSGESALLERAETLGVVEAVSASGLPASAQRRVSVAIVREAERNGVDPMLVIAVIRAESSFNSFAVSHAGAMGLMQVMPDTGEWLMSRRGETLGPKRNLFDQELNIELGTAYLAELIERFGNEEKALVAYNAGPTAARRILAKPDVRKNFVAGYPAKVLRELRKLKSQQLARATRAEEAAELSDVPQTEASAGGPAGSTR